MKDFDRLSRNIESIDLNDIFFKIWSDNRVQNFIIKLNTEGERTSQLIRGIDSEGLPIEPPYSIFTIQKKVEDGQISNWVTLKDTGDFYETFVVTAKKRGFSITANPIKGDNNLFDKYGEEVVGLTEENQKILLDYINEMFIDEFNRRLFQ